MYEQDGKLRIKIADDGVGMDGEKVAELNEYINAAKDQKDSKKSIGIRNVNQRIKLSCGEEYGVTITSYPYQGSCFSLGCRSSKEEQRMRHNLLIVDDEELIRRGFESKAGISGD